MLSANCPVLDFVKLVQMSAIIKDTVFFNSVREELAQETVFRSSASFFFKIVNKLRTFCLHSFPNSLFLKEICKVYLYCI